MRSKLTRLAGGAVVALAIFFATPLSYFYGLPLLEPAQPRPADVIVLMSSGLIRDRWLTPDAAQRTLGALSLYRDGFAPRIISSGSLLFRGEDQAAVQADWLRRAGVPSEAILIERRSSRTYHSAVEVARLMRERGWRSAVVVTSELDVPRVRLVFRKLGVPVSFLAVPEFRSPRGPLYLSTGYAFAYHATYEYAALLLYKCKGWI
ncbi:MAG: YdcF family protein [Acidobacteria bacterium]|nr:YdcF family protein [Acidobacteriota bacterium]